LPETTFYEKFKANMDLMGLPAPKSLFETTTTAVATIGTLARLVNDYGSKVTVMELIKTAPFRVFPAKVTAEFAMFGAGLFAAFYVGACIGSFVVATGQTLSTSSIMATMTFPLRLSQPPWLLPAVNDVLKQRAR
jgi:hypothetical protein